MTDAKNRPLGGWAGGLATVGVLGLGAAAFVLLTYLLPELHPRIFNLVRIVGAIMAAGIGGLLGLLLGWRIDGGGARPALAPVTNAETSAAAGPIAVSCACGARLEFDAGFAGKVIPCPDCQRPLDLAPPPPPDQQTSLLAMASLFLSLAGACTLIISLAGAALGFVALQQIDRAGPKLAGRRLAKAGIFLGIGLTLLTTVMLLFGSRGFDGWLRAIEWAGKLDYSKASVKQNYLYLETRPRAWGHLQPPKDAEARLDILLYNPFADSFILGLAYDPKDDNLEDSTAERRKALSLLEDSDMARMLRGKAGTRPGKRDAAADGVDRPKFTEIVDLEDLKDEGGWVVFHFDYRLGGRLRAFRVGYRMANKDGESRLLVFCGVCRKEAFDRLDPQFKTTMPEFKWE